MCVYTSKQIYFYIKLWCCFPLISLLMALEFYNSIHSFSIFFSGLLNTHVDTTCRQSVNIFHQ